MDEALAERVGSLEKKLADLAREVHQRRQTIPTYIAQRLDEQLRREVTEAVESVSAPEDLAIVSAREAITSASAAIDHQRTLAIAGELQQCAVAAGGRSEAAAREVQSALDQVSQLVANISEMQDASARPCATTRAIAHVEEKENDDIASLFRRRAAATEQPGPCKVLRLT